MASVNFYLKKPEPNTGKSLIYLQFTYSGQKLIYSFNEKVFPANWNGSKQRVKNNKETTADGQHSLNDLLDSLDQVTQKAYREELKNGLPGKSVLKAHLDKFFYKNLNEETDTTKNTLFNLFERFVSGEIKKAGGREKSQSSLNNYNSVLKHLRDFQKRKGYKVDYDTINKDFFDSYISFLRKYVVRKNANGMPEYLSQNTIAKDITLLKVVLAEAVDRDYTTNLQFKKKYFTVASEEIDAVYLKKDEITKLYEHDFKGHKKLEQVRDLFIVGCLTGLRYSDYSNIRPENIIKEDGELFIKINTQKTGELVIIPCDRIVLKIFEKYASNDNRLPRSLSNQKFNDYVKEACEAAGLTETGRLMDDPEKPLYECISSHTARRSFATNLYREGFPALSIMKITGHRTEKAFLKYIRVSKLDAAKQLSEHFKKVYSSVLMKAV